MKVLSVNVSKPQVVEIDGKMVSTGIFKRPVKGPVMLRELDFDGDAQADLRVHGGPPVCLRLEVKHLLGLVRVPFAGATCPSEHTQRQDQQCSANTPAGDAVSGSGR
mgnify:CR=1 FL=1